MLGVAKAGIHLLSSDKPHSSVSVWIDTLCQDRYEEDDYDGIGELVQSINLQSTGSSEASRAIRKKLKYSNIHGQLRSLTILKALVENCGTQFQTTFATERLVDRIKLMVADPVTDTRVKKKIMNVLRSWYLQFKEDPKMQLVAGLYNSCGGGKKTPSRTAATETYENQQAKYDKEAADRSERKMQERSAKVAERARLEKEKEDRKNKKKPQVKRPPFNFESEKPKIMATVGHATQSAQNLINALQHVNREKESVTLNERVIDCLAKAKADRKTVVRYIQLVDNDVEGDYIGTLLSTNEQVLTALALYDRMSKPVELDSDDEHMEEVRKSDTRQGLFVPEPDGDTASIRSRLSAFDIRDGEIDKLQERQRSRLDQNRARTMKAHPDLQDLAFGGDVAGSSSLAPPIHPTTSAVDEGNHGTLSDYSDYSSSEGEDYPSHRGAPPTSASASFPSNSTSSQGGEESAIDARSYAKYIQEDKAGGSKGLLEDDDDPFADEYVAVGEDDLGYVSTPGIADRRMNWREV